MNTAASTATDWNALDNASFRATLREFFEKHFPSEWRYPQRRLRWSEIGPWYLKLSEKGWVAPSWPAQYGAGTGRPGSAATLRRCARTHRRIH